MAQADSTRLKLSSTDLDSPFDLRSFYDPSPFTVNHLCPLNRVYRLFNDLGVRHIPVLDDVGRLAGIITRKDVQPEAISRPHTWCTPTP